MGEVMSQKNTAGQPMAFRKNVRVNGTVVVNYIVLYFGLNLKISA